MLVGDCVAVILKLCPATNKANLYEIRVINAVSRSQNSLEINSFNDLFAV